MPRKKYEKRIIPYMKAYPMLKADKTFESLKKESSKFVRILEDWMEDAKLTGEELEVEIWEETLFPGILKAKTFRSRIYTSNKKINQINVEIEIAKFQKDQAKVDELLEKKSQEEELVAGAAWRIYKIYAFIRPQIVLGNTDKRDEEYSELEVDPEKGGGK